MYSHIKKRRKKESQKNIAFGRRISKIMCKKQISKLYSENIYKNVL